MGKVTVRVTPRSGRRSVEAGPEGVAIRVRAAAEGGKATDEARRALAETLGVPASRVRLASGARSRTGLGSRPLVARPGVRLGAHEQVVVSPTGVLLVLDLGREDHARRRTSTVARDLEERAELEAS
jgi:hypothetical protein